MNILKIFLESGLAAQIIMVILIIFSIWSWAIFFKKLFDLARIAKRSQIFLATYRLHRTVKDYENLRPLLNDNPYGQILKRGHEVYKELKSGPLQTSPKLFELADNIRLAMDEIKIGVIENLEGSLPTLGSIVTASPLLGLLGTVWGIMESFLEVRARGSAHITIVAPGISDALITTVYGLLVAIPSLMIHNYLRNRINRIDAGLDKFIDDAFAKFRRGLIET